MVQGLTRIAAGAAIFGIAFLGLTTVILHLLPTGYDPTRQVVSDYAVGPFAAEMSLAFFVGGAGVVLLALSLYFASDGHRLIKAGALLLLIAGAALFIVGAFPTDIEGAPVTQHGTIHGIVSQVVFTLGPIGMLLISYANGRRWLLPTVLAFIFAGSFFAANGILGLGATGLAERLFIAVLLSWWILVAYRGFRKNSRRSA